jgi:hypothetical protein
MDETRYIRGRRVVFERREPVETLRYSLDVFDDRDNLIEVLGRLADLGVAQAAYEAAVRKHPDKRICLRQTCRSWPGRSTGQGGRHRQGDGRIRDRARAALAGDLGAVA